MELTDDKVMISLRMFIKSRRYNGTMKLGFLVNPIAGMGGKVGLKGTDNMTDKAIDLGAEPVSPKIAGAFIKSLGCMDNLEILTCGGSMGADHCHGEYEIVYEPGNDTAAMDTKMAVGSFKDAGAELIVFCGGDGTARDVADACGDAPILGIPCGVKMYSSVFATSAENAARVVCDFASGGMSLAAVEIMDIDEEKFRLGELDFKLLGTARTPFDDRYIQRSKSPSSASDSEFALAIAEHLAEIMEPDILYILCPGMIKSELMKILSLAETKLGIDTVLSGELAGSDLNEAGLLKLLSECAGARIIVTPIGSQGFVFGRGNQQVSEGVISKVGTENVWIVATPQKLALTPRLFIHTGNEELDAVLAGFKKVLNGYRNFEMRKIEAV